MLNALQHLVTTPPDAHAKQPRRFAETLPDHRIRLDAEVCQQICGKGAQCHLAEQKFFRSRRGRDRFVPEPIGRVLTEQVGVLRLLTAENFRPLNAEVAAHSGEVIARTREHERHFPSLSKGGRVVENAVPERGAQLGRVRCRYRNVRAVLQRFLREVDLLP